MTEKPKCPDHPKAGVVSARKVGTSEERWYCLECRKDLGFAGHNTGEHEPMDIGRKDVGKV
jgi:hypothetical protein